MMCHRITQAKYQGSIMRWKVVKKLKFSISHLRLFTLMFRVVQSSTYSNTYSITWVFVSTETGRNLLQNIDSLDL